MEKLTISAIRGRRSCNASFTRPWDSHSATQVHIPAIAWKVVNITCATFVATSCIFFIISGGFRGVVLGILGLQLAALIIALEFKPFQPVQTWAPFLFVPLGRGMTMFVMAIMVLDAGWWLYILSLVLNGLVGIYYMACQFVPALPQPILSAAMLGLSGQNTEPGLPDTSRLPYADLDASGNTSYNYPLPPSTAAV